MNAIPKVGLVIRSLDDLIEKRVKRDKRVRSLQEISKKLCEEFKTINSILLTKYCSHRTEISTKDIVTLPTLILSRSIMPIISI